jgi:hypothetical protein
MTISTALHLAALFLIQRNVHLFGAFTFGNGAFFCITISRKKLLGAELWPTCSWYL